MSFARAVKLFGGALAEVAADFRSASAIRKHVARLGWILPGDVPSVFEDLGGELVAVRNCLAQLETRLAEAEWSETSSYAIDGAIAALLASIASMRDTLDSVPEALLDALGSEYCGITLIDTEFLSRFYDNAVVSLLEEQVGAWLSLLVLAGVVERVPVEADPEEFRPAYVRRNVRWERLAAILTPVDLVSDVYSWGSAEIDHVRLTEALIRFAFVLGFVVRIQYLAVTEVQSYQAEAILADCVIAGTSIVLCERDGVGCELMLCPLPAAGGSQQPIVLKVVPTGLDDVAFPLTSRLALRLIAATSIQSGLALVLTHGVEPRTFLDTGVSPTAMDGGEVGMSLVWTAGGDGVSLGAVALEEVEARLVVSGGAAPRVSVGVNVAKGALRLVAPGNDGLLAKAIPDGTLLVPFSCGIVWDAGGLHFTGAADLSAEFATGYSVRGCRVEVVKLTLDADEEGASFLAASDLLLAIGPFSLGLRRLGVKAEVTFAGGNLGPIDLATGVLPPLGGEVEFVAGPISGKGGFEVVQEGEYAGAVVLRIFSVCVSAAGFLDTNRGSPVGYSLVGVVSTQFAPVQLGLGFALEGVGGLFGANRAIDVDALRSALGAAGIEDICFAADSGEQARSFADSVRYFPTAEGRYLFGPAFKLAWGTPTLVEATVALLLEVPSPIRLILLGNATTSLPTKDHQVVVLNIDVLGEVDFSKKTVAIDASLVNSKIARFPITGDLAFRMGWGDPPNFVLSIGGFHSHYQAPPDFPELRRVKIPIGSGDNPRLDAQGFLALTSNTLQVGAQVDLYAAEYGFNISGSVGFETLIQFSPFALAVDPWPTLPSSGAARFSRAFTSTGA